MRIAIDATALLPQPTGVDRYIMGLIDSLAALDRDNHYLVFANAEDRARFGAERARPLPPNFAVRAFARRARAARLAFQQIALPVLLAALRVDVLHSPTFIMPLMRGRARHVLTVHDMTSFLVPELHPSSRRGAAYERAVATSIRGADVVSVPSPSVAHDIARFVPDLRDGRVRVIASGVDERFRAQPPQEVQPVLDRLDIVPPYILYVGTLDPRKNLPVLIDTYARLVARGAVREQLVLAGQPGWSVDTLLARATQPGLRDRVRLVGYVPDRDLPALYSGARAFAYPSLLEGFGFPPLEAMACGVPVVTSDSSSLRDHFAGAAVLVPPRDVDALAGAIARLLTDERHRRETIAAGLACAARFRWERFARSTLACYAELAGART